jgi:hypothetical protein
MNFQNTTHVPYLRSVTNLGIRQQLQSRDVFDLPGGLVLWKAVGKITLLMLPFIVAANMFIASILSEVDLSIASIEAKHHEVIDKNIGLRAQKARLYAPDRLSKLAADRLFLFTAEPGQIERIN